MTERLLREACRAARAWPDHLLVAVNVSPVQLRDRALPGGVRSVLEPELTESALVGDLDLARKVMGELKALSVRLAPNRWGLFLSPRPASTAASPSRPKREPCQLAPFVMSARQHAVRALGPPEPRIRTRARARRESRRAFIRCAAYAGGAALERRDRRQPELFVAGPLRELLPGEHVLVRIARVLDLG